jgi:mevalonate pyrophosphate decarboxylase
MTFAVIGYPNIAVILYFGHAVTAMERKAFPERTN